MSVGTSWAGVPRTEPWGSQVPSRGLSWPLASCPRQVMSGSSTTAGAALLSCQALVPVPAMVVSVSRDALVASPACSGGAQRTGLPLSQCSLPGAPAPLGSPDASQAGDWPGHCCPQAGLCRGSLPRCRVPPGDSPAISVPWALVGTPADRSSPQVTSRVAAMVSSQLVLQGWGGSVSQDPQRLPERAQATSCGAAVPMATHCPGREPAAGLSLLGLSLGPVPSCPHPRCLCCQ